jgi:hypothetical protein
MNIEARRSFAPAFGAMLGIALAVSWPEAVARAIPTSNQGQAYIDECRNAGVPTPPNWTDPKWIFNGVLSNPFIGQSYAEARVYYYVPTTSPSGLCYALPRLDSTGKVKLLGIICQGDQTSRACFWDNSAPNGNQFDIANVNTFTPLSSFNGGAGLAGATGGVCTSCHTGENVFNIHPGTALDLSSKFINDKPASFVQPIVAASWPQNPSPNVVDGACGTCHNQGIAGRFPLLSTEVSGYCGIMATAYTRPTMPPAGTPDSPDFKDHFLRMQQACAATQPPSPPPGLRQPAMTSRDAIALMWLSTD